MMRAAIYARVSTDRQETENQLIALRGYADRAGLEVVHEYSDFDLSGYRRYRPELERLKREARGHRFQVVLVTKIDRLARSLKQLLETIEEFDRLELDLVTLDGRGDTRTPQGKLFFQVTGAFAEFEGSLISERTKLGLARARAQGKRIGAKPKMFDVERARALKAHGRGWRAIGRALGVDWQVIRRRLRKG